MRRSTTFDILTLFPRNIGQNRAVLTKCYVANSLKGNFSLSRWYDCCNETE